MSTDKLWTVISGIEYQLNILKDKLKTFDEETNQKAYQRGLEDGKAQSGRECDGCQWEDRRSCEICETCCNKYQNQWQAKDEIKVGDEVVSLDKMGVVMDDLLPWIVTSESVNYYQGIDRTGNIHTNEKERVRKTGRHFDIASILKEMQT